MNRCLEQLSSRCLHGRSLYPSFETPGKLQQMPSTRYLRQTVLPEVGASGQHALLKSRVLIVGVGGLGSPAALYLTAAGVGHIGIVDADTVDETNLQRQILYRTQDVGKPKVDVARQHLQALNPESKIEKLHCRLTSKNVLEIFSNYDLIIDGTDNFSTKYLINDAAVKLGKTVVFGAISQWEGRVSVFDPSRGPCYRCIHPTPPKTSILNCAEAGVIGAIAGAVGSIQAAEAIKLILLNSPYREKKTSSLAPLIGKLWVINCASMDTLTLSVARNENCRVCSQPKEAIQLEQIEDFCTANLVSTISAEKLASEGLSEFNLLDVREENEWAQGHLPNACFFPLSQIEKGKFPTISPHGKPIVLYCKSGIRSGEAARLLSLHGWQGLLNLEGGIMAWNGLPQNCL